MQTESCFANNFTLPPYFSGQAYSPGLFQAVSVPGTTVSSSASISQQTGTTTVLSPSQSTNFNSSRTSYGISFAIGLAVGLPLGILGVGILAFLIWRERGQRSEERGKVKRRSSLASPYQHLAPARPVEDPYEIPEFRNELSANR